MKVSISNGGMPPSVAFLFLGQKKKKQEISRDSPFGDGGGASVRALTNLGIFFIFGKFRDVKKI